MSKVKLFDAFKLDGGIDLLNQILLYISRCIFLRDDQKYSNLKLLQNKPYFTCKSTNFLIQIRFRHYLCYCLPLYNVEIKFELIDPYHLMRSTMYIHTFMGTTIIIHQTFFPSVPFPRMLYFGCVCIYQKIANVLFCRFLSRDSSCVFYISY